MAVATGAVTVQWADPAAPWPVKLLFTAICGGAGIANDLDGVKSKAAQSLGFVTWLLAVAVRRVSGGHREATHELTGEAFAGGLAAVCVVFIHDRWAQVLLWFVLAVLFACCLEMLPWFNKRKRHLLVEVIAVTGAALMVVFRYELGLVAAAVVLGMAAHVAGDSLTEHGTYPFKPLWKVRVRLPKLLRVNTGHWPERKIIRPVAVVLRSWRSRGLRTRRCARRRGLTFTTRSEGETDVDYLAAWRKPLQDHLREPRHRFRR